MLIRLTAVGIGGSLGALLRYLLLLAMEPTVFPFGTIIINIVGSFLLGGLTGYISRMKKSGVLQLALGTGFCGGFTTMSTFAFDAVALMKHSIILSSLYVGSTVLFSLIACYLGLNMSRNQSGEKK